MFGPFQPAFKRSGLPLRARLQIYFLALVLILLAILLPLLYSLDIISSPRAGIGNALDTYLTSYEKSVSLQMGNAAASSTQLSQELVGIIEETLARQHAGFADISNNPKLIEILEYNSSKRLSQVLRESRCSGAFVIFDATVNTELPNADRSRCGVYLKLADTVSVNQVKTPIFWLRGMPAVADMLQLECHNKWDMEFDISILPPRQALLTALKHSLPERYFFTEAQYLRGTWEKVLLVCVPLFGRDGTLYGLCGLEISGLLFKLAHAHLIPPLSGLMGMLALRRQDAAGAEKLDTGAGFHNGPALAVSETFSSYTIVRGQKYSQYDDGSSTFAGMERPLRISPLPTGDRHDTWVVAAMLPQERVKNMFMRHYALIGLFIVLFLAAALIFSFILSKRYATPVLHSVRLIREGGTATTSVQEIDDLVAFLKEREQEMRLKQQEGNSLSAGQDAGNLQVDTSACRQFIEQIETLSKAERLVFDLYISGLNAREIAAKLNLSINTIRTHNRNIYAKLNVSSYKEMMVYVHMMAKNAKTKLFH